MSKLGCVTNPASLLRYVLMVTFLSGCSATAGSTDESMKAAIDAKLAAHGYGRICIDGPNGPQFSINSDSAPELRAMAKKFVTLGFARVASVSSNPLDGTPDTNYDLTAKGHASYATYDKLGSGGDYHGWCFAEYRVGRIVKNTTPSDFMGHKVTTVTYYPRIIKTEEWAKRSTAASVAEIRGLSSFESNALTMTLEQTSDGWEATDSK